MIVLICSVLFMIPNGSYEKRHTFDKALYGAHLYRLGAISIEATDGSYEVWPGANSCTVTIINKPKIERDKAKARVARDKASKVYDKARVVRDKSWKVYSKTWYKAYIKAYDKVYKADEAKEACQKAYEDYRKANEALDKAYEVYQTTLAKIERGEL